MPPWLQVLSTLGAAIIGGVIAPQITQARERRATRAMVLDKVRDVEDLRWGGEDYLQFRRAIAALESAAIIARLPRLLVMDYLQAAQTARTTSVPVSDEDGHEDWVTSVSAMNAVESALDRLTLVIWHPILGRRPTTLLARMMHVTQPAKSS